MANEFKKFLDEKQVSFKHAWDNVWYVFKRDIARLFSKPLLIFVFIGALLLPCLYSWLTVWANWDPYGNTGNLKVCLVNEDKGVDSTIGGHLAIGDELEKQLGENDQLGWTFTDRDDAFRKLESGEVYATIIIPEYFSNDIAQIFVDPENRDFAKAQYYVNERENGAAVKITDTGASAIEQQINEKFVGKVTEVVAGKVVELSSVLVDDIANNGNTMSDRINRVAANVSGLNNVIKKGQGTISQAQDTISSAKSVITDVKNETDRLIPTIENAKQKSKALEQKLIEEATDPAKEYWKQILLMVTEINFALDNISDAIYSLNSSCVVILRDLDDATYMLGQTNVIAGDFSKKMNDVHDILLEISATIQSNLTNAPDLVKTLTNANSQTVGAFMSTPVNLESEVLNPISNNGTGISPFFTNLALWVLGIVLIALFRTEVEPPKRKGWNAKQAYVARAMLFSVGAFISAIFVSAGNLIIGIQCESPVLYVLTCMLIAFVFVNIIYMLAACFKHVGRALACILVIMQIPGSSGMFPIQLMPPVFQNIFPFLPFTYGINALRECIINIDWFYWFLDLVALGVFFCFFFFIGLYARNGLRGINKLFDEELAKNTIMISDAHDHIVAETNTVETVVENLTDNDEAMTFSSAIDSMRVKYKRRSRYGLWALAIGPTSMLIIMSIVAAFIETDINTKLIWMTIWMLSVILITSYVIVNEYKYKQFKKEEKDTLIKAAELSEAKANA